MKLDFLQLFIENFGSFAGKHQLKLDAPPGSPGSLNFVRGENRSEPRLGSNGVGKSTLLNALCWCLYGKTTNGLLSTDLRPWSNLGRPAVSVLLGIDGRRETITRGSTLTIGGHPAAQEHIDKLVGMSFEVFRQTIMLGQGRPLFHDLPNREKLQFLSDVLDLERWDRYAQRASDKVSALNRELFEVEGSLFAVEPMIDELRNQEERQEKDYKQWEAGRTESVRKGQKLLKEATKALHKIENSYADANSRYDMEATNYKIMVNDLEGERGQLRDQERELHRLEARFAALSRQREEAAAQLKLLTKSKLCPACKQTIRNEKLLLENRKRLETVIADYLNEAEGLHIDKQKTAVEKLQNRVERLHGELVRKSQEVVELEEFRNSFRDRKVDLEAQRRVLQKELERWEGDVNPHRAALLDLRKLLKQKIADKQKWREQIELVRHGIETTGYWVKAFKDIRLYVLEDVLQELEFVTNGMLDDIGLVGWEVHYDVERETKSGTVQRGLMTTIVPSLRDVEAAKVKDVLGRMHGVKLASWSGGEGQRLRLVGALALSQVLLARAGVDCNVEVLDEPTRHLSTEGVEDLCEFLARRAEEMGRTIWLVDHKAIESSHFGKTITVVKDAEGSSLH